MPLRIAHVSDSYLPSLGGIEVQVSHLAQQQQAAGHEVVIITTTPPTPGAHGTSVADEDGLRVHRIAARIPGHLPIHPRAAHHVERLLRQVQVDVVHLHMGMVAPTAQTALGVVRRLRLPAVVTVHSVWGPWTPVLRASAAVLRWPRWPVELATVSDLAAAPIRSVVGDAVRVHVLRNGVDTSEWALPPTPPSERPYPGVHAVVATRFAPRKRVLPLLEVLRQARAHLDGLAAPADSLRLDVTIAGEGEQMTQARRFVEQHGMSHWVHLPGRLSRDELKELYRGADVYLAPGVLDAFSVAIQEAQAAGLAVLTRSQSGAAELLTDGVEGLLADDDAAMARGLARLVAEDGLLEAIVRTNREVPPQTSWPVVVRAHDAVYATALARYGH